MAKRTLKVSQKEVSLTLNLKDVFGKTVPDRTVRELIADDVKNTIIKRTLKGYGVDNGIPIKFKPYSKEYAAFKGQTNVDLELTGSMLNSITALKLDSSDELTVGIANKEVDKAYGHQTGQEGKGPLPKRPFIDLTEAEINLLKKRYQQQVDEIQRPTAFEAFKTTKTPTFTFEDIQRALDQLRGKK